MATYRALQSTSISGSKFPYVQAGTILVDGPGGTYPD